jgi:hypothetical protein
MPPTETPIESVRAAVHNELWVKHKVRSSILVALMVLSFGSAFFLWIFGGLGILPELEFFAIPALLILGAIPTYFLVRTRMEMEYTFFAQMAASFGLSRSKNVAMSTVSGHLFCFGHSRRLSRVFEGTYSGHDLRIFTYTFVTGSGKHQRSHFIQVFEANCHTELPELMVHSKRVAPGGMSWQPNGTRPLRLEGLFNEQFEVYAPTGMEIEALQVLEPQHMDMLMQKHGNFSFYTHATKMYVFTGGLSLPTTRAEYTNVMELVDNLYDTLVPELHGVSGDVTALREAFANGK